MDAIARAPRIAGKDIHQDTLKPGDMLLRGQYRIEEYLGAGGFGITYRARDCLDRGVVIKECYPKAICTRDDKQVATRSRKMQPEFEAIVRDFGLEARRMSRLVHPNIAGVHQVFEENGTVYMAMDLVPGRDLLDIIEKDRDRFTPADVKEMLTKLLGAIAYLHDRDILHRDISPDNILVDEDANPVLIDFGAAHEMAARSSARVSELHTVKDGYSPQEFYLSKAEQDASSDLYSLAATFYHLVTGSAPADSQTRLSEIAQNKPDPLGTVHTVMEGYDHYFTEALERGLEVFPKDRLRSARDWITMIDEEKRRKSLAWQARNDEEIDRVIRELTAETNLAIAETLGAGRGGERTADDSSARGKRKMPGGRACVTIEP